MKNKKKLWYYLSVIFSISFTIIIINNINNQLIPKVIQDINCGVIGAILTAIITLILLSNQTNVEENIKKKSVIFEEKLKVYTVFLKILGDSLKDGKLSPEELKELIFSFSTLKIHLSKENAIKIEKSITSIDHEFFFVDENLIPQYERYTKLFNDICNVFRQELYNYDLNDTIEEPIFSNFYEISFEPRITKISVFTFEDMLDKIKNFEKFIFIKKDGVIKMFSINNIVIEMFISIYNEIDSLDKKYNLTKTYSLYSYQINSKKYIKTPTIIYKHNEENLFELSISDKNRVILRLITDNPISYYFENNDDLVSHLSTIDLHLKKLISKK